LKILVIGAGAFGTALASTLAKENKDVTLWVPNKNQRREIDGKHFNQKYLPGIKLSERIITTENLKSISKFADIILLSIPAQKTRLFLRENKDAFSKKTTFVLCGKGIDAENLKLQSDLLLSVLPKQDYAVLSGPGFATEIAKGLPTALIIAHSKIETAKILQENLSTLTLRLYASSDPYGVQLGGSLKNIIAIACGISEGLELGESARTSLMIRGFSEICNFAVTLGAQKKTLFGLSGFGDLSLTCNSTKSRNFLMGKSIVKKSISEKLNLNSKTVEGVRTSEAVLKLSKKLKMEMPIVETISQIIKGKIEPNDAVQLLLSRPLKIE
tara:strand:+ start:47 stop:1030 length:984 start_codon:yes stop_codon:yes gene_type:complete